jgi:hypothetical protein
MLASGRCATELSLSLSPLRVGLRLVAILAVSVLAVRVVAPVPVIPVTVATAELRNDLVRDHVRGEDGRRGGEPWELAPDVVLQQHIRVCPPAEDNTDRQSAQAAQDQSGATQTLGLRAPHPASRAPIPVRSAGAPMRPTGG